MIRWKKANKRSVRRLAVALVFNAVTVFVLVAAFYPQLMPFRSQPKLQAINISPLVTEMPKVTEDAKPVISGKPTRIEVPSVQIDIPVADGVYNPNTYKWTLSSDKAHYALLTPLANDFGGNTFIYGHNRRAVFARLVNLKAGDMAKVYTDNGYVFTYKLSVTKDVDPTDISLFEYQGKPILTLQTCTGTWYQDRRLFTFDFIEVQKL